MTRCNLRHQGIGIFGEESKVALSREECANGRTDEPIVLKFVGPSIAKERSSGSLKPVFCKIFGNWNRNPLLGGQGA